MITARADGLEFRDLGLAHLIVINIAHLNVGLFVRGIFVDPNNHLFPAINHRLTPRRTFFNFKLGQAAGHGFGHAAHLLNLFDQRPGLINKISSEFFHIVRARQRINHIGHPSFFLQNELCIAGNACRGFRWQGNGLIKTIGMQRLRAAQNRGHRFKSRAHDVVIGILLLQTHTGGLAMGPQHAGFGIFRVKFRHNPVPQNPCSPQFRRFHKEIHTNGKEKRQTPGKGIHIHPPRNRRAHIFAPICNGIGQFLHQIRTGLLHVITADRNGVELRHITGGKFDNIGHNTHGGLRWVNISIAHHEFFENVILDCAREGRAADALLFTGHDEGGQNRDHRAVHRHGDRNLIQRDAIKEGFHILYTVNRHPSFTNIADNARMIAVIAPMRGQIEGH